MFSNDFWFIWGFSIFMMLFPYIADSLLFDRYPVCVNNMWVEKTTSPLGDWIVSIKYRPYSDEVEMSCDTELVFY